MKKHNFLFFSLTLGLILMVYSWFSSFPLMYNSVDDYVFNHLSIYYWFGLPISLASMFVIATTSENNTLKWIMTLSIVTAMYSLFYYHSSLPTSDANLFRGLQENFANTKSLEIASYRHSYYQWPSVFILTYIATSISGISLANLEFLMFGIIGFLLATTLYVYSTKSFSKSGFIAVIAFFIVNSSYVNYQFAPYTIALCFLMLLFILDTKRPNSSITVIMLLLFFITTFTHAFVPIFFSIFLLVNWIITRSKRYGGLFLFTLSTYFLYQFTSASYSFANIILRALSQGSELPRVITIIPWFNPIDAIAQNFTVLTISLCAIISFIGFILLLVKRKLRYQDKAIFIAGIFYIGLGAVLYSLGSRAIAIAFIAVSLGASYLHQSRFKPYLNVIFLILLLTFTSILVRSTFVKTGLFFQTNESYESANFAIANYNWDEQNIIVADYRTTDYLAGRTAAGNAEFSIDPDPSTFENADMIFYTLGLGINMDHYFNHSIEDTLNEDMLNVCYDNGYSMIITRNNP